MAQEFWIFLISGLALLIFALAWLVIMLISKFLTKIVYSYPSQNHRDSAIQCTISLRYVKLLMMRSASTHPSANVRRGAFSTKKIGTPFSKFITNQQIY